MRWSTAAGGREGQCIQPYTLLGTPFRWVCATAGDLALYIGSDKKLLDHRSSKACNLVKPGSFSLKFSRKPSLVLLYRYKKKSELKSAKKIHSAIPTLILVCVFLLLNFSTKRCLKFFLFGLKVWWRSKQYRISGRLRGAWRDRDTNDIFAHCSLVFYFLDFKFSNFVCPSVFYRLIWFFLQTSFRKKKNIRKTTQNALAPCIHIVLSIALKLGTPLLYSQAQNMLLQNF